MPKKKPMGLIPGQGRLTSFYAPVAPSTNSSGSSAAVNSIPNARTHSESKDGAQEDGRRSGVAPLSPSKSQRQDAVGPATSSRRGRVGGTSTSARADHRVLGARGSENGPLSSHAVSPEPRASTSSSKLSSGRTIYEAIEISDDETPQSKLGLGSSNAQLNHPGKGKKKASETEPEVDTTKKKRKRKKGAEATADGTSKPLNKRPRTSQVTLFVVDGKEDRTREYNGYFSDESADEDVLDQSVADAAERNRKNRLAKAAKLAPVVEHVLLAQIAENLAKQRTLKEQVLDRAVSENWPADKFCMELVRVWRESEHVEPCHAIPEAKDIPMATFELLKAIALDPRGWDPAPFLANGSLVEGGRTYSTRHAVFYVRHLTMEDGLGRAYSQYILAFPADAAHGITELLLMDGNLDVLEGLPAKFAEVGHEATMKNVVEGACALPGVAELGSSFGDSTSSNSSVGYGGMSADGTPAKRLEGDHSSKEHRRLTNFMAANRALRSDDHIRALPVHHLPANTLVARTFEVVGLAFPMSSAVEARSSLRAVLHESLVICPFRRTSLNSAPPGPIVHSVLDPQISAICRAAVNAAGEPVPLEPLGADVTAHIRSCYQDEAREWSSRQGRDTIVPAALSEAVQNATAGGTLLGGLVKATLAQDNTLEVLSGLSSGPGSENAGRAMATMRSTAAVVHPSLGAPGDLTPGSMRHVFGSFMDLYRVEAKHELCLLSLAYMYRLLDSLQPLVLGIHGEEVAAVFARDAIPHLLRRVGQDQDAQRQLALFRAGTTPVNVEQLFQIDRTKDIKLHVGREYRALQGQAHIVQYGSKPSDVGVIIYMRHDGSTHYKGRLVHGRADWQFLCQAKTEVFVRAAGHQILKDGRYPAPEERRTTVEKILRRGQSIVEASQGNLEPLQQLMDRKQAELYVREDVQNHLEGVWLPPTQHGARRSNPLTPLAEPDRRVQLVRLQEEFTQRKMDGGALDPWYIVPGGMDIEDPEFEVYFMSLKNGANLQAAAKGRGGRTAEARLRQRENEERFIDLTRQRNDETRQDRLDAADRMFEATGVRVDGQSQGLRETALFAFTKPGYLQHPSNKAGVTDLLNSFRGAICAHCREVVIASNWKHKHSCPIAGTTVTVTTETPGFVAELSRFFWAHHIIGHPSFGAGLAAPAALGLVPFRAGDVLVRHLQRLPPFPRGLTINAHLRGYGEIDTLFFLPRALQHDERLQLAAAGDVAFNLITTCPVEFFPRTGAQRDLAWSRLKELTSAMSNPKGDKQLRILTCPCGYYSIRFGSTKWRGWQRHKSEDTSVPCKILVYELATFTGFPCVFQCRFWRHQCLELDDGDDTTYHDWVAR